ncbi:MAG: segregation/condensation protein A [Candidatus Omnitrophica bacterium]|jgi:segregation and condensation protein A|nr:segregation/condensation protein A [Candidatus Omnitrophota bacterium]MDD4012579.1 segregation/condensation protein A [Candidatus Omnitrophota bacterium]
MTYKVKLQIFDGPLDLLLFLIKKEKIDIYDIPIAKVTGQYLEYMELMQLLDLDIAGEFIVMAATLMHIKSKMLLPPEEKAEDDPEEEDPREELVRKLLEYKKYKDAAARLKELKENAKELFVRKGEGPRGKIFTEDGTEYFEASLFDLISSFRKVLNEVPKEAFHQVVKNEFTVSDKIHAIYHMLADTPRIYFSRLFREARSKSEVIVTFLAVLELMKAREILAVQQESFGEIEMIRNPELVKAPV